MKNNSQTKNNNMQLLLEKELETQAQLKKCQDNLDIFETYYLQNSWRTGNVVLGWPICSYSENTQFINRPSNRRGLKQNIQIESHEKLFSISSLTSEAFGKISMINYLATKELPENSRPKIFRLGRKPKPTSKVVNIKAQENQQEVEDIDTAKMSDIKLESKTLEKSGYDKQQLLSLKNEQAEYESNSQSSQKSQDEFKLSIKRVKREEWVSPKTQHNPQSKTEGNIRKFTQSDRQIQHNDLKKVTFKLGNELKVVQLQLLHPCQNPISYNFQSTCL